MMNGIPFCGAPPVPGGTAWNFDPALLLVLLALGAGCAKSGRDLPVSRRAAAGAGWLLLVLTLISPLCNLAVALFSARIGQHLLITLVAAPLLALAIPQRLRPGMATAFLPALVFAVVLWFWHLPGPYAATFAPDGIAWWLMHVTLAAASVWLWAALLAMVPLRPDAAALGGLLTALQMGLLGALLTFAPRPLYAPHGPEITLPWGLTPLEDQQLGGLLMWVPGGLLFAAVMVMALASVLQPASRRLVPLLALALALPVPAWAQGNDATTSTGALGRDTRSAAPVGVLTTSEVTTRSSGPPERSAEAPAGADRRVRVLGPVCRDLEDRPALLAECRAKSGL